MPSKIKIHTALLSVAIIYSANYSIAKIALPEYIAPFAFIILRVVPSAAIFWIISFFGVYEEIRSRKDFIRLIMCAVLGAGLNQLIFFQGLSETSPISASVITTCTPIVVLIASYFILKERVTTIKLIGIALGAIGALSLVVGPDVEFSNDTLRGNLLILLNTFSFSLYLVLVKPLLAKYHVVTIVKWVFLFGSIIVIPFGVNQLVHVNWLTLPVEVWLSIGYVIIFTTVLTFMLNAWSLNFVNPSVVGYYVYLQPFFAALIAFVFRGDELNMMQILSALFIFSGVFLVSYRRV